MLGRALAMEWVSRVMKYSYTRKQIVMRPYGANYLQDIQQLPLE